MKLIKPYTFKNEYLNEIKIKEQQLKWDYDAIKKNVFLTDELEDIQGKIDEFKDQTEIYKIIDRYQKGSSVPLTKNDFENIEEFHPRSSGQYADITNMPSNLHELKAQAVKAQETLNKINEYIKAHKDNETPIDSPETKKEENIDNVK